MCMSLVLVLCFLYGYGLSHGQVIHPDNQPQQWRDLVTFVNQKIDHMENALNSKGERIDQLESKLHAQETEISSLKRLMIQKDVIISDLVKQVSELKKAEFVNKSSDTSIKSLAHADSIGASSPSNNGTSDVTNHPNNVTGDRDTHAAGDVDEEYKNRQQGVPSDATIPKQFNRVAPPTPKQTVAFHAYLTSTVTLGAQATVIFNHEALDQGDGYNPADGLYTVPESGTYVITWTMFAYPHNAFQNELVVNGARRGMSWTDSDEINDYHQTTGITVTRLTQGDHVFIRMGQIYHGRIFSNSNYARPTFSGWKLD